MISFIFSGITLAAVFIAAFVTNMRLAILALWVAGLGVGAVYLTLGAELLAIVQWIVSTLVTIAFIFFAVMFGEYRDSQEKDSEGSQKSKTKIVFTTLSLLLGAAFALVIWNGSNDLPASNRMSVPMPVDLGVMGKILTQENLLSLEVLALTLFLVLIGGGVVARLEREDHS